MAYVVVMLNVKWRIQGAMSPVPAEINQETRKPLARECV